MALENINVMETWDLHSLSINMGSFGNSESTMTKIFVVENAENEQEAVVAAYNNSPAKISDLKGKTSIPKKSASVVERCGETTWKVQVEYALTTDSGSSSEQADADGDDMPEVSFQVSTGTTHITRPYDQVLAYRNPNFKNIANPESVLIGWNGEFRAKSEYAGVDVHTPECREQYKRVLEYDKVRSSAWRRKIASCVGKINKNPFKGWNGGEVLFVGCSYTTPQRGQKKVAVTFEFIIQPNEENAEVCGHRIGGVYGHDYVWVIQRDSKSQSAINKEIAYIFKSRVYKGADFDKLGI